MNRYVVIIKIPFMGYNAKEEFIHKDVKEALDNWEYAQQCGCPEYSGANIKIITPFCYE